MKRLSLLFLLLAVMSLSAQQNGIDQSLNLVTLPTGEKVIHWYGHTGRSYFVQASKADEPLKKWSWAPIIESGNDEEISHEVEGTPAKGFFRLKYTDQVPGPGETLDTADFDDDGISNIDEINPSAPLLPTDPLNSDTDADGLNDGWERSFAAEMLALGAPDEYWGVNLPSLQSGDLDPLATLQNDGMTIQEIRSSTSLNDYQMILHDLFIQAKRAEFGLGVSHESTAYDDGSPTTNQGGGSFADGSGGFGSGTIETWSRTSPSVNQLDVQLDPFAVTPNTSLTWFNNESQHARWTYHTHWVQAFDPEPGTLFPIEEMNQSSYTFMLTDGGGSQYYQFQGNGPVASGQSTTKTRWAGGTRKSKFRLYRPRPTKDPVDQIFLKMTTEHPLVMIGDDPYHVGWSAAPPTTTVESITATIPAFGHTSPWIETTPEVAAQNSRSVELVPLNLHVFERDQVSNRIPNPKKPGYSGITSSANPEEAKRKFYNRLFVATEPESGDVEITVKHAAISQSLAEQLSVVVTDDIGNIIESYQMDSSGETDVDFLPSGLMVNTISYFDLAIPSGTTGELELLLRSFEKNDGPSIQVATPQSIAGVRDELAILVGPFSNTVAGSFYKTFLGTASSPNDASSQEPEVRSIDQEPPTMIAGSPYDQTSWTTEIPSFLLADASGASNIAETYFSHKAGFGLHEICRNLMQQNSGQIWSDLTTGGISEKVFTYPILPGTGLNFYYPDKVPPKYIWGGATYRSGTVILKLKRAGNKIVTEEVKMQAEIEDYYDFDYTKPTNSFSRRAATIQIGHEMDQRPAGKIFHTVTEVDFSYDESTGDLMNGGIKNGGPPIAFFNENGYIQDGVFVTTGGGGGSGNE